MRSLSLRAGLIWLVGVVLLLTLFVNVAVLVLHAGPRIRAEDETTLRLTHELLATALASLQETADPAPALRRFYESLGALRHVDIKVLASEDAASLAKLTPKAHDGAGVPDWFVSLVDAPTRVSILRLGNLPTVLIRGVSDGRVAIVSNPIDELAEIWSDLSWLAFISLAATLLFFALVLGLVHVSLAPFDDMRRALTDLEAGKSNVRVALRGASEFRGISSALNSLAATLDQVKAENQSLMSELFRVQEKERREIARDLHDEAGPCLFSIRAGVVALSDMTVGPAPDLERLRRICAEMNEASEAMQALVRGLLGRLKPRGLAEFGLATALDELIASWRASRPDILCELAAPHDLSSLEEPTLSAAYRVVQEAMTNVFRHSDARRARIGIEFAASAGDEEQDGAPVLQIVVEDDGVGMPGPPRYGRGLLGMRERAQALGGWMTVESRPTGGLRIFVSLPVQEAEEEEIDERDRSP
ncbi:ATP-binding protein [Methylosinus sp. H3A]|uniref:histidine kinase n=1 Tax=Methylosinus sp. H3A TaxID=2785786 RepID=UPI0018C1D4A6|nr:histidine kinase [Methylosinus sp. H3A]MBG0808661.1 ATP-binding protein [Methylosinus sp. H3A]